MMRAGMCLALLVCATVCHSTMVSSQVVAEPSVWRAVSPAEVSIGLAAGEDPYLLSGVADLAELSDGTLVVVLFFRNFFELRYFDESGQHITSSGRYGDGPFEVGRLGLCCVEGLPGDSLLVVGHDGRTSVFGPRGERVRTGRLPVSGPYVEAGLVDPTHLAVMKQVSESPSRGVFESHMTYLLVDLEGQSIDTIGTGPGHSAVGETYGAFPAPFSVGARLATGGGAAWFGNGNVGTLRGASVGRVMEIPARRRRIEVGRDLRDRYRDSYVGSMGASTEKQWADLLRSGHFPDSLPRFQDLEVDAAGNLWVMDYQPRWAQEGYGFDVYDRTGRFIARAEIPFRFLSPCLRVRLSGWCPDPSYKIGRESILATVEDDLGVQRVIRFRIDKTTVGRPRH